MVDQMKCHYAKELMKNIAAKKTKYIPAAVITFSYLLHSLAIQLESHFSCVEGAFW